MNSRWADWYYRDHELNKAKKAAQMAAWRANNLERSREQGRAKVVRLRDRLHAMYGEVCALCGFSDRRALTLDHVVGNGGEERREHGEYGVYRRALTIYRPAEYRILCMNCQFIERQRLHLEQQHSPCSQPSSTD